MDNIQFWLYVIIAIIALIAQMRKKKQEQAPPAKPHPSRRQVHAEEEVRRETTDKPLSFEDLLKEILEAKEPVKPTPVSTYEYEEAETEIAHYPKDETFDLYKKSTIEATEAKTLEDSIRKLESQVNYEHFKHYEVETVVSPAAKILEEIKEPGGMRKAIIFSEILNRKHF